MTALITSNAVFAASTFKDVDKKAWYYQSINGLAEKKIVSGYGDSTFRPMNKVKVEEFIKMLTNAMGLETKTVRT